MKKHSHFQIIVQQIKRLLPSSFIHRLFFFSLLSLKMTPQTVAVKNNIDVFYFSVLIPLNIFFVEDGKMERQVFLATWKDIPNENELQYQIKDCHLNADTVSGKLQNNNVYTIAKRNVEGQDMLYQSLKLTNGIWILAELRIQPGNPNYTVQNTCTWSDWERCQGWKEAQSLTSPLYTLSEVLHAPNLRDTAGQYASLMRKGV
uniref:Beta-adaptin appendage C-terminal subdomain domain-containing protein n=1 Tax=Poecilia mexicana TaxID=48701 RepID=A0A3B3XJ20_9TELE